MKAFPLLRYIEEETVTVVTWVEAEFSTKCLKSYAVTGCLKHTENLKKKNRKKKTQGRGSSFPPKTKTSKTTLCMFVWGGGAGVPTSSLTLLISKVTYKLTRTSSTTGLHNIGHYMIKAPWLSSFVGQGSKSPLETKTSSVPSPVNII